MPARTPPLRPPPALKERLAGRTLEEIGALHGVTHEGARKRISRESSEFLARVETRLLLSNAAERKGKATAWPTWELPHSPNPKRQVDLGPKWLEGAKTLSWVAGKLLERGFPISIEHAPSPRGSLYTIRLPEGWERPAGL